MIKPYTIEMIEKLAVTDGTVKAAVGGTKNCFIGIVTDGVVAPADTTGAGMKLFANYGKGDDMYKEFTTPEGECVTAWDIEAWMGKELQATPESITYAEGETYADITVGTEMKAGTDGNLVIGTATTGDICFVVAEKINFGGNGVRVKIVKKA